MGLHMALDHIGGGRHFLGLMQGVVSVRISVGEEQLRHSKWPHQAGPRACEQWLLLRRRDRSKEYTRFLGLS